MTIIEKAISALVGLVILALVAWWISDSIITSIRAPVVARAEKAETANLSVINDNAKLQADITRLNQVQRTREDREVKADQRLKRMEDALKNLAKTDPIVRDWLSVPVPDGMFGLRTVPETGPGNPNPKGSVFDPLKPDRAGSGAASLGKGGEQRGLVGTGANPGSAIEQVQPAPTGRAGVSTNKESLTVRLRKLWGDR